MTSEPPKSPLTPPLNTMTPTQKRLLRLVYGLGAVLVLLFVVTLAAIVWQLMHLNG